MLDSGYHHKSMCIFTIGFPNENPVVHKARQLYINTRNNARKH